MNRTLISSTILAAAIALLTGCDQPIVQVTQVSTPRAIISEILDYGPQKELDGCTIKYVRTNNHPYFWFVKCPNGKVSTMYDTGGKSRVVTGAMIE